MSNRLASLAETVETLPTVAPSVAALLLTTVKREADRLTPAALAGNDRDDIVSTATLYALAGLTDSVTPSGEAIRTAARRALSITLRRAVDDATDRRSIPVGSLSTDDDDDIPAPVRLTLASAATPDGARIAATDDHDRLTEALTLAARESDPRTLAAIREAAATVKPREGSAGSEQTLTSVACRIRGGRRSATLAAVRETLATLTESGTAVLYRHSVRSHDRGAWSERGATLAAAQVDRTPVPAAPTYGAGPVVRLAAPAQVRAPLAPTHGPAATVVTIDGTTVATFGPDAYAETVRAFALPSLARSTYVPTGSDREADGFAQRQEPAGAVRKPSSRKRSGSGSTGPTVPARLSR